MTNCDKCQFDPFSVLEEINKLIENDFCAEMEVKILKGAREYTQRDAKAMAGIISTIYYLSHQTHCEPCREGLKS